MIERNPRARVVDRGSYLRVLAPFHCVLDRRMVEHRTGQPFSLPTDLELVMSAFQGKLEISEDKAEWKEATP